MFKILFGIEVDMRDLEAVAWVTNTSLGDTPKIVIERGLTEAKQFIKNAREMHEAHLKGQRDGA